LPVFAITWNDIHAVISVMSTVFNRVFIILGFKRVRNIELMEPLEMAHELRSGSLSFELPVVEFITGFDAALP
jgi:hypothetical protein